MNDIYRIFLETVARSREMEVAEVDKIARGRIWSGSTAKELNLVDKLGGISDAIAEAKKAANIPASEEVGLKIYPRQKTLMELVYQMLDSRINASANPIEMLEAKIDRYKNFFPALMMPFQLTID